MATEWYVRRKEKKLGPFSNKDLRKLVTAGKLAPSDLIWREGLADWVAASRVESLFEPVAETTTHGVGATADSTAGSINDSSPEPAISSEEAGEEEYASEGFDDDDLPPLPPIVPGRAADETSASAKRGRTSSNSAIARLDSAERLCWWLRFYASVNFAFSIFIATPMFLFGLFAFLWNLAEMMDDVTTAQNTPPSEQILHSFGLMGSAANIVFALLCFMLMNVFTLACHWGAEVLTLLKLRR